MKIHFGSGTMDRWGFGFYYCHYDKSFAVEFLRWYAYFEVWRNQTEV
jgi:hypothetical protein